MRNIALALGSFIVGASTMFLLLKSPHASILPQASAQVAFHNPSASPVVPTVMLMQESNDTYGAGTIMEIDGVSCANCTLQDGATIRYSGGLFALSNLNRSGKLNIDLRGPAL